jgi:hypothetical protein
LGAIALIRRGIKNIIVVDAEYDEDYTFQGYYILKDRLKAWGLDLRNDLLDSRKRDLARIGNSDEFWHREQKPELKSGEFIAKVFNENEKEISTIYYIKMSVLGDLKKDFEDKYFSYIMGMKKADENLSENAKMREFLNKNKDDKNNWQCEKLKKVSNEYDVIKMIEQEAIYRAHGEHSGTFPQTSTIYQSWYTDQTLSFIGLGYLQGKRLIKNFIRSKKE